MALGVYPRPCRCVVLLYSVHSFCFLCRARWAGVHVAPRRISDEMTVSKQRNQTKRRLLKMSLGMGCLRSFNYMVQPSGYSRQHAVCDGSGSRSCAAARTHDSRAHTAMTLQSAGREPSGRAPSRLGSATSTGGGQERSARHSAQGDARHKWHPHTKGTIGIRTRNERLCNASQGHRGRGG